MPGVITFTIKAITLTIKVITPFMPVSYLFHKLKSGHPNLYIIYHMRRAQKIDSTPKPSVQALSAAHRSPCEPHKGLTGGGWEAPGCPLARRFSLHRAFTDTRFGPKSDFFLA